MQVGVEHMLVTRVSVSCGVMGTVGGAGRGRQGQVGVV